MISFFKKLLRPKQVFLYNHLGLGDHIILNALIRELVSAKSDVIFTLFVKSRNYESVKFMFSDLKNFTFCVVSSDDEVLCILNSVSNSNIIKIGFNDVTNDFDKFFYKQFNLPFSKRFNKDILNRDFISEDTLFKQLNLEGKEYIFVHDDITRDLIIDDKSISNKDMQIIRPHITNTIFDWCKVLENAVEIHCMCSSFKALVDSMQLTSPKLFYHHSLSNLNGPRNETFTSSNLKWTII